MNSKLKKVLVYTIVGYLSIPIFSSIMVDTVERYDAQTKTNKSIPSEAEIKEYKTTVYDECMKLKDYLDARDHDSLRRYCTCSIEKFLEINPTMQGTEEEIKQYSLESAKFCADKYIK